MEYIVVRGAGDLATGVIQSLWRAGFNVVATEAEKPTAVRRLAALSECVYTGKYTVEDITAKKILSAEEIEETIKGGLVPVIVDESCGIIGKIKPLAVIDAIIAKKNIGTVKSMAPITIALGPGFIAPIDVDCVIETMRGHNMGRLIFDGEALPNTGEPGDVAGRTLERVLRPQTAGKLKAHRNIGDIVKQGELICEILSDTGEPEKITASIDGVLRGLLRDGTVVGKGMKLGDVDPRASEAGNCATISDKARGLGGAALTALIYLQNKQASDDL